MITFKDLIPSSLNISDIPIDHQHNLENVVKQVNGMLTEWGKPVTVTSGYRSIQDHKRIYSEINAKRRAQGLPEVSIPIGSKHLSGLAVDLYDPKLELTAWLKAHPEVQEKYNLFFEEGNSSWVHAQIVLFGSYKPGGTRWFKP